MTRAILAIEARIDRGLSKIKRQTEAANLVQTADTAIARHLDCLPPEHQPEACRVLLYRVAAAYVARIGKEDAHPTLAKLPGLYAPELDCHREAARKRAGRCFRVGRKFGRKSLPTISKPSATIAQITELP